MMSILIVEDSSLIRRKLASALKASACQVWDASHGRQGLAQIQAHDIVVNKHQGCLAVDSTVGRGTTFTLRLPVGPGTAGSGNRTEGNHV